MSDGIADLGGAVVDLAGGCYLLSAPLSIPQFFGNVHMTYGELRADAAFPLGGVLVSVGATPCTTPSGQGSCNENVGFHGVTLDGSHLASSCLVIAATMGAVLDASSAVFGFTDSGVLIRGGHETMISDTWVAAWFWSSPNKEKNSAIGILVDGNDHYLSNLIVYSARVGVEVRGAANILSGVHTWNDATGNGGIGILNTFSQNRFDGCYLDFTDLVLQGSNAAQQTLITNGFFLGGAQIVFNATTAQDAVFGCIIANNAWYDTGSAPLAVVELGGATWASVTDLSLDGFALQQGQPFAGAVATAEITLPNAPGSCPPLDWMNDFSASLLFPSVPIVDARWVVQSLGGSSVTSAAVLNASYSAAHPQSVHIYATQTACGTDAASAFILRLRVDQSARSAPV